MGTARSARRRRRNLAALAKRRRAARLRVRVLSILPRVFPDQDARCAALRASTQHLLRAVAQIDDEADVWPPPHRVGPETIDAFVALAGSIDRQTATHAAGQAAAELRTLLEHTAPAPRPLPRHRNTCDRLCVLVASHNADAWLRDVLTACAPRRARARR